MIEGKSVFTPDEKQPIDKLKESARTIGVKLFLGGTIEMGKAVDWQKKAQDAFEGPIHIYNPRKAKWTECDQEILSIPESPLSLQILWEQTAINNATHVIMNFEKGSQSPISLLEFGQLTQMPNKKVVVSCPREFWRYGNVAFMARAYNIHLVESVDEAIALMKLLIKFKQNV